MLYLSLTTDKISLISGSSGTLDVHASYVDLVTATGVVTPDKQNTAITTATTTDILASPAAGSVRNIKHIGIRNKHATTSMAVTVQYNANGTLYELFKCTLLAQEEAQFVEGDGWEVYDSAGGVKQAGRSGRYLRSQLLTSGTSFITSPETNTIRLRMVAGGGQGGGCTIGSATISGAAGGGAAGGYAEKTFAVTPNTAYAYTIGAGGTTGAAGANPGQAGGNTTFVGPGPVTVTANGGPGGLPSTSAAAVTALGGASPAVSTNGDINMGGAPGANGHVSAVAICQSGAGGSSELGAGGVGLKAQGTGVSAATLGFGGGGGGGCAIGAVAAVAGGAGAGGAIMIDEYA